jgi:hypothetical protein
VAQQAAGDGNRSVVMPRLAPCGTTAGSVARLSANFALLVQPLHLDFGEFPLPPLDAQPQA